MTYEGETFKLDDSKGCYVEVTYKGLTGYFGVNIKWHRDGPGAVFLLCRAARRYVTPEGLTSGDYQSPSS